MCNVEDAPYTHGINDGIEIGFDQEKINPPGACSMTAAFPWKRYLSLPDYPPTR